MAVQSFPSRLNLKDIEEQVRHMLDRVRRGDAKAFARWYSLAPRRGPATRERQTSNTSLPGNMALRVGKA